MANLYYSLDNANFINGPGDNTPVSSFSFQYGASAQVNIGLVSNNSLTVLPSGYNFVLGFKQEGNYQTGNYIAYASTNTVPNTGAGNYFYQFSPNFYNSGVSGLLGNNSSISLWCQLEYDFSGSNVGLSPVISTTINDSIINLSQSAFITGNLSFYPAPTNIQLISNQGVTYPPLDHFGQIPLNYLEYVLASGYSGSGFSISGFAGVTALNGLSGMLSLSGFAPLSIIPSGNQILVSGNFAPYVTNSQTGIFLTTGQSGLFIPNSQLSSLVTTGQTGSFATTGQLVGFLATSQTGSFLTTGQSGLFYPASNPSSFITPAQTGGFVNNGQTGIFLTTGQSGLFYANSNPSGFVPASQTGIFVTTGQTGQFASSAALSSTTANVNSLTGVSGKFYLNSNPSGFVTASQTGGFVNNGQTGAFLTTGQSGLFAPNSQTGQFLTTGNAASEYYSISNPSGFITGSTTLGAGYYDITGNQTLYLSGANTINLYFLNFDSGSNSHCTGSVVLQAQSGTQVDKVNVTFPTGFQTLNVYDTSPTGNLIFFWSGDGTVTTLFVEAAYTGVWQVLNADFIY